MLKFLKFPNRRWLRRGTLAASLLSASALVWAQSVGTVLQDRQPTWQASQASTKVPPVTFKSVFSDLPKGVENTALDWKAANANVGQFRRGHVDLLQWEQAQAENARTTPDTGPRAKPVPKIQAPAAGGVKP